MQLGLADLWLRGALGVFGVELGFGGLCVDTRFTQSTGSGMRMGGFAVQGVRSSRRRSHGAQDCGVFLFCYTQQGNVSPIFHECTF